jgi:acid stress chaperone HdeA
MSGRLPLLSLVVIVPVLVASAVGVRAGAAEAKKPVAKWTCADFLAVDEQFRPKVVYWATAYAKGGKPEASVIDIDGTEKVTPMIIEDCTKAPQASFWQRLKADWAKVKAAAKAETKKVEKKM